MGNVLETKYYFTVPRANPCPFTKLIACAQQRPSWTRFTPSLSLNSNIRIGIIDIELRV